MADSIRRIGLHWGVLDQASSSATNFALTLVGARLLHARGLGTITLAFVIYVFVTNVQRSLIGDPLLVTLSETGANERLIVSSAVTMTITLGAACSVVLFAVGEVIPLRFGHAILIMAPWAVPAVLQDLWRCLLFRVRRGRSAALNDGVWLAAMMAGLPIVLFGTHTVLRVWLWWVIGLCAAALLGFAQTRVLPEGPRAAWVHWRDEVWPFSRWLLVDRTMYNGATQAVPFVVAAIIGPAAVGGMRAVQSIFGPITYLNPVIALPGQPAIRQALEDSPRRALRLAIRLGAIGALISLVVIGGLSLVGHHLLTGLFGSGFGQFTSLILPMAAYQTILGSQLGAQLLLKAARRGTQLVKAQMAISFGTLAAVALLVKVDGVVGAIWGLAFGALLQALLYFYYALPIAHGTAPVVAAPGPEAIVEVEHIESAGPLL